jgi:hypothetical protein
MNQIRSYIGMLICCLSLSACMYPTEQREQLADVNTHVARVQAQSEQYLSQNKVLPYKYSNEERKFTTHYLVDLSQLAEIPPTAYEKGGHFIYVFVGAEGKQPLVRLFDLRVNDQVEKVQLAVNDYKMRTGKFPIKAKESAGYADVDLAKLSLEDISIPSPFFSDAKLPILIDNQGRCYLDYRGDVTRLMQTAKQKPTAGVDLRRWMSDASLFVPAFSPMMKLETHGGVVFTS